MEAKYNPETTDSSDKKLQIKLLEYQKQDEEIIEHYRRKMGVYLPKLSTIETYNGLIEYVQEMYLNGMIVGDEFVMKPSEEQRNKLIDSTYLSLYGDLKIGEPTGFYNHYQEGGFVIETFFGVKIIIK